MSETPGLKFFNSKNELCLIKTKDKKFYYIELLNSNGVHYKVMVKHLDKYFNNNKYKIAAFDQTSKFLYV
jgi:hypothetical protein